MKILGVDLSYSNTGFTIYDTDDKTYKVFGKQFPSKLGYNRLVVIHEAIKNILVQNDIDMVIQQNYSFGSKFNRQAMGQLGGIAKYTYSTMNIPYILIPPTVLKKFVCGKGVAQKDRVRLQAFRKWNIDFSTNDQVDSFVLAKIGQAFVCHYSNIDICNRQIMDDILKSLQDYMIDVINKKFNFKIQFVKKEKRKKCTKTD